MMAKYIKSDGRILSEEEQQAEVNGVVIFSISALIVFSVYSIIGISGPIEKISLVIIGVLSLFFVGKYLNIIYMIVAFILSGFGLYYLGLWIFQ